MSRMFEGKVALVTGGGSGIGAATALELASRGASMAISDIAPAGLDAVMEQITRGGGSALAITGDVTEPAFVERMVAETVDRFGRLDVAVNSAGVAGNFASFADLDYAEYRRVIGINQDGVFLSMKAEINAMLPTGGAIVNIGSIYGSDIAMPHYAAYQTSKAGVCGLTRSAALDYAARGIRVNAVALGMINTPLVRGDTSGVVPKILDAIPMHRIAEPEEVAKPVCFLLSDEASFMTGSIMVIDGGYLLN